MHFIANFYNTNPPSSELACIPASRVGNPVGTRETLELYCNLAPYLSKLLAPHND